MSQKKCKYCGNYYDYSVTSNGYSEDYCKFSCESYARINELKKLVEEKVNITQQLKAEIAAIADSVADYTATGADADTVAFIVRYLRQLSAV